MRWCASKSLDESKAALEKKLSPETLLSNGERQPCRSALLPIDLICKEPSTRRLVVGCDDRLNRVLLQQFRGSRRLRFLLPLLLSLALPVMAAPKYKIQVRNQFGGWQQYQTVHHLPSAARTAQTKATQSGKQYRIVDEDGNLMDLFYP